jgi:hypothetical protein
MTRLFECFVSRDGLRYRWHTVAWVGRAWRQRKEGFAVVDDFGNLVSVPE